LKTWFIHPEEGRPRAGWRILLFLALFVALAAGAQLATRALLGSLPRGAGITFFLVAGAATLAVVIARRWLDRKRFVSLGLGEPRVAWRDVLFGFALSGLMAGTVLGVMASLGIVEGVRLVLPDVDGWRALGAAFMVAVVVGYWEELVFRGYLLQNLAEGMGMPLAVGFSCLLYGAVHAGNPHAGLLSTAIIVVFGFLRIYGYLATRLLWLSIGMHIGWNFFQGPVFGYAASGQAEDVTLFRHRPATADWLSGGDFGPEASVITLPVILLALLAMRAWSHRSGGYPPRRSAGRPIEVGSGAKDGVRLATDRRPG
jgi:membrane protease YdiL (CAAX protease family)